MARKCGLSKIFRKLFSFGVFLLAVHSGGSFQTRDKHSSKKIIPSKWPGNDPPPLNDHKKARLGQRGHLKIAPLPFCPISTCIFPHPSGAHFGGHGFNGALCPPPPDVFFPCSGPIPSPWRAAFYSTQVGVRHTHTATIHTSDSQPAPGLEYLPQEQASFFSPGGGWGQIGTHTPGGGTGAAKNRGPPER